MANLLLQPGVPKVEQPLRCHCSPQLTPELFLIQESNKESNLFQFLTQKNHLILMRAEFCDVS